MRTAKRIRLLRNGRGWTQGGLASRAHVSRWTIRRLERGYHARMDTLYKIANAFQVGVSQLIDPEEQKGTE